VSATAAPVLAKPDAAMVPLRMAKEGSVLTVLATEGAWFRVEFQDPQYGRRVGYIEKQHVSVMAPVQQAMDLSVPESGPARNALPTPQRQVSQTVSQPSPEKGSGLVPAASAGQPTVQTPVMTNSQSRNGFWFNGGLGYGSMGCENCIGRVSGASGGLALGATMSDRLLFGVGTTAWYKSEDGFTSSVGTFDARLRFYPSVTSGFFLTGGLGLGTISAGIRDVGTETEVGVGLMLGLGWDIRVSPNVSLTPFWNGSAVNTANANSNFGQLGLGVTIH
jgi:hypothetical protein